MLCSRWRRGLKRAIPRQGNEGDLGRWKFAQDRQIPFTDFGSLARTAAVRDLVGSIVEAVNGRLARVEQLKDFRVIDQLLTAEDEEMTPTMKLKRRVVARRYATLISSMYRAQSQHR